MCLCVIDIQLRVDRRTTLSELKKKLEVYVGVESMFFKMYRVYNNQQEYEIERPSDTLMSTPSDSKVMGNTGIVASIIIGIGVYLVFKWMGMYLNEPSVLYKLRKT